MGRRTCTIRYMPGSTARERLLYDVVEFLAEYGLGDRSLRAIAEAVGTSHRMLIYHFGSREGLLAEVVVAVESGQRDVLAALTADPAADPRAVIHSFWTTVSEAARRYGALFFEFSAQAMQGRPHVGTFADALVKPWIEPLADVFVRAGVAPADASVRARLGLGVARGLLHDALVTGDWDGADAALSAFVDLAMSPASNDT